MWLERVFIGCLSIFFWSQDLGLTVPSFVLADGAKYHFYKGVELTWDEANDYCRDNDLVLPFSYVQGELEELRKFVRDNKLELDANPNFWMGGRAEGTMWRWDFGSKNIIVEGWFPREPQYNKTNGVTPACMELRNENEKFRSGLMWSNALCDDKRKVICQKYN